MANKELVLILCGLVLPAAVFGVDCSSRRCLTELYNSRVRSMEKYRRSLASWSTSSSAGSGLHQGIVVTLAGYVIGQNRWLIHKGNGYGDRWDTIITDADYMSSAWTLMESQSVSSCSYTVNDFLQAGLIDDRYNLFYRNCIVAVNKMWNLASHCHRLSQKIPDEL